MNARLPLQSSFKWWGRKFGDGKRNRKVKKSEKTQDHTLPADYIKKLKKRTLKVPFSYNKFFIFLKAKFDKIFKLVCIRDGRVNSKYIDRINKFYNGRASDLYKLNYQILAHSLEKNTRYYSDISMNNSLMDYEKNINIRHHSKNNLPEVHLPITPSDWIHPDQQYIPASVHHLFFHHHRDPE